MSNAVGPLANPRIILREEFDDWAVLFDPDTGEGYGLDPIAVFYWKRLDGKHTRQQLLEELRQNFEEVPDEASEHLEEFLTKLQKRGFVNVE